MRVTFGIDVSQEHLDLAAATSKKKAKYLGKFKNTVKEFPTIACVIKEHAGTAPIEVVMEPTGSYGKPFAEWCHKQNWKVSLPNPKRVRDWASGGRGTRAKTDPVDAKILALFGYNTEPPAWHPLDPTWAKMDELLNLQSMYEKNLRMVENQLHAINAQGETRKESEKSLNRTLKHFKRELAQIDKKLSKELAKDEEKSEHVKRLQTCPGVGEKLVLPLLILLAKWDSLTSGQGNSKGITALVGLDPRLYTSGSSVYKHPGISKMGDRFIRSKLFAAACGGISAKDNPLVQFYRRLIGRGKGYKVSVVACARKILVWSWAIYRDRKNFEENKALPH